MSKARCSQEDFGHVWNLNRRKKYALAREKSSQRENQPTEGKNPYTEKAIALIVNGFSKDVLNKLPMEFAVEAQKLLEISLEGSVG